ncbi:hypothetical protein F511_16746 [Dorcoceras hygrometricum]|uniref:Uncharacterized protein n=1 Tax=Dorcoceras hygrometricum TaxID=472368 RepID=A0A2Z7B1Z9_9LAMI|nr:hypothetical protein F511_16746 [Dorcoceras hygrometricum]
MVHQNGRGTAVPERESCMAMRRSRSSRRLLWYGVLVHGSGVFMVERPSQKDRNGRCNGMSSIIREGRGKVVDEEEDYCTRTIVKKAQLVEKAQFVESLMLIGVVKKTQFVESLMLLRAIACGPIPFSRAALCDQSLEYFDNIMEVTQTLQRGQGWEHRGGKSSRPPVPGCVFALTEEQPEEVMGDVITCTCIVFDIGIHG